ncbi:MAG TPA: hypothetical protein VFT21_13965, partial [Gemmatimonadaceae bacterium]|nr:hypothetical protein [Gemmatimonadaceae bacterium]
MCGIAGIETSPNDDGETLGSLLAALRHRGPDDSGRISAAVWEIGMTRLAIMDPEHAHQPMCSADERWWLVVNGEIYNFRRLREDLIRDGVRLRTRSDTEVLLELIARRGPVEAIAAAEGMFALAAVDTHRQELWLGRDRFGEKPLYLDYRSGFGFASELTPLLARRGVSARASAVGLIPLLRYGFPAPGTTAIEGISELPPAHWLRRTRSGNEIRGRYWAPPDRVDEEPGSL